MSAGISTKKTTLRSKRKARDICTTHEVTRDAHQLCNTVSIISAQKIRFARPNGDFTFIQTSRSYKLLNCPGPFVANDHCVQFLQSFNESGCLRGDGRRDVSIMVGFCT